MRSCLAVVIVLAACSSQAPAAPVPPVTAAAPADAAPADAAPPVAKIAPADSKVMLAAAVVEQAYAHAYARAGLGEVTLDCGDAPAALDSMRTCELLVGGIRTTLDLRVTTDLTPEYARRTLVGSPLDVHARVHDAIEEEAGAAPGELTCTPMLAPGRASECVAEFGDEESRVRVRFTGDAVKLEWNPADVTTTRREAQAIGEELGAKVSLRCDGPSLIVPGAWPYQRSCTLITPAGAQTGELEAGRDGMRFVPDRPVLPRR